METVLHLAKLVGLVFLLTVLVSIVGGWVLSLLEPGPWDKTEIRDDERPVDFIGRRLP